jgi:ubiquinone/menaquinone biosynthesis C-methylase UbiE
MSTPAGFKRLKNVDTDVVEGFGKEWSAFSFGAAHSGELRKIFEDYFSIFPKEALTKSAVGFDAGSGSGRWAALIAPLVGKLHCVDASSEALAVSKRKLERETNVEFHEASAGDLPFASHSMDFGYSLGVLHHLPDTQAAVTECARVLKPGAPFLVYLYYAFDNRPVWFRAIWRVSDWVRSIICRLPFGLQSLLCNVIAIFIYWPLARASRVLESVGLKVESIPLSIYRQRSLYIMRNDALDRMATKLEKRFTADQIRQMLEGAGFQDISFSQKPPYWCAVGRTATIER